MNSALGCCCLKYILPENMPIDNEEITIIMGIIDDENKISIIAYLLSEIFINSSLYK